MPIFVILQLGVVSSFFCEHYKSMYLNISRNVSSKFIMCILLFLLAKKRGKLGTFALNKLLIEITCRIKTTDEVRS